jgi:hypothetical protein
MMSYTCDFQDGKTYDAEGQPVLVDLGKYRERIEEASTASTLQEIIGYGR